MTTKPGKCKLHTTPIACTHIHAHTKNHLTPTPVLIKKKLQGVNTHTPSQTMKRNPFTVKNKRTPHVIVRNTGGHKAYQDKKPLNYSETTWEN